MVARFVLSDSEDLRLVDTENGKIFKGREKTRNM